MWYLKAPPSVTEAFFAKFVMDFAAGLHVKYGVRGVFCCRALKY